MEELLLKLKQREAEFWIRLEDPTLTNMEKEEIESEINKIHNEVMELKLKILGFTIKYGNV